MLTLIHVYAPTNNADELKDHFYEKLQAVVENDGCRRKFCLELRNRFEILQKEELEDGETDKPEAELEKANSILEKAYNMTTEKVLRYKTKKVEPWISIESWDLIEQSKVIKLKLDGTNSKRLKEKR